MSTDDRNDGGLMEERAAKCDALTTGQGLKVGDDNNSLKAGERGPTLLEDFILREKITHFDHERSPERVVYARGEGAYGYFQPYKSAAKYSKAKFLQDPNKKTETFVRFSTAIGARGSKDTARDVRGFAVKFYTEEGVYDLISNNIPVFFVQDAVKFPDVVHAMQPEQDRAIPQASSAHATFWDFMTLTPESTHMLLWLMSDRALPRSVRMMEGYGVNTYRLIDAKDRARLVKFHWKPKLGAHSMTWDEARKLGGIDPDYHRRDLWDAIERKDYPEFELAIQVIEEEDQDKFPFDPLDATKVWPLQLVPLEPIGKLVLNRNPDNYFAETEQVAFNPAHLVPGIDFSDDPLLQGRLISYLDAQIHRLGSPNFDELAINRPKGEIDSNRREGQMRQRIDKGRAAYSPNSLAKGCPMHAGAKGYGTHPATETGTKTRARGEKFGDHFGQAQLFWRSQSEIEQRHIVEAFVYELSMVDVVDVRRRAVDLLAQVDAKLAGRVADGLGLKIDDAKAAMKRLEADWKKFGVTAPPGPRRDYDQIKAPELSLEKTAKDTIRTRKIAVLVADGVEGNQVEAMRSALTAEGAYVEVVAPTLAVIKRADGKTIAPDNSLLTASSVMYDAIYVPGGPKSVATLKQQGRAIHFINEAYSHYKTIAATDEGIDLLLASGIGAKDEAELLKTAGVVGSRKAGDTKKVAKEFASAIAAHRHWEREVERVPA